MTDKLPVARYLLPILIFCFLLTESANAQPYYGKYLSAEAGFKRYKEVDKIISPLFYESSLVPLELEYRNVKKIHTQMFNLSYYAADLNSVTTGSRTLTHLALSYTWLRNVVGFDLKGVPAVVQGGFSWVNRFNLSQQTIDRFIDRKNLIPSGYLGSEIELAVEFRVYAADNHLFYYTLQAPFIRYLIRPGYSFTTPAPDETDSVLETLSSGEWRLFSRFLLFDQSITYRYSGSRRLSYFVSLSYNLNRIDFPRPYALSNKGLAIGIMVRI